MDCLHGGADYPLAYFSVFLLARTTDYRSASLAAIWPAMATAAGSVWLKPHAWTSTATLLATVSAWQVQCLTPARTSEIASVPAALETCAVVHTRSGPGACR